MVKTKFGDGPTKWDLPIRDGKELRIDISGATDHGFFVLVDEKYSYAYSTADEIAALVKELLESS